MGPIDPEMWDKAARTPYDEDLDAVVLEVLISDPDLGVIAVARSPDGREAYGADSGECHES